VILIFLGNSIEDELAIVSKQELMAYLFGDVNRPGFGGGSNS
jgi:hypothetical protein